MPPPGIGLAANVTSQLLPLVVAEPSGSAMWAQANSKATGGANSVALLRWLEWCVRTHQT